FFFFFQAEDGIRDKLVTGVQTCALPIFAEPSPYCRAIGVTPRTLEIWDDIGIAREMIDAGIWITGLRSIIQGHPPHDAHPDLSRSEERRVGKECRSRW